MQLAYNHLKTDPETGDIMTYYGTLGRSLAVLFCTGGLPWKDVKGC